MSILVARLSIKRVIKFFIVHNVMISDKMRDVYDDK